MPAVSQVGRLPGGGAFGLKQRKHAVSGARIVRTIPYVAMDETHATDAGSDEQVGGDAPEGAQAHDCDMGRAEGPLTLLANFRQDRLSSVSIGFRHVGLTGPRHMALCLPDVRSDVPHRGESPDQALPGNRREGRRGAAAQGGKAKESRRRERAPATSARTSSPRLARTMSPAIACMSSSVAPIRVISAVPIRPTASTMRLFAR